MTRPPLRAALTQTRNAYTQMPDSVDALDDLTQGELEAIRTANVAHHVALIREAHAHGARLVGLGELCTGPYFALERRAVWRALAEDARTGPSVMRFAEVARELGVVIVAPIYERDAETDARYNTAVVIDADGAVLGGYRKTHIPQGQNERATFVETYYYGRSDGGDVAGAAAAGKNLSKNRYFPVFETQLARVGVAICYDRHFEGVIRSLAEAGAELILSPAVTFGEKSRRMWEMEFAVDACRHRVFIGGSNRLGAEKPWGVEYFGASYFVGPDGRLPDLCDHPSVIVSDLDLQSLRGVDPSGWNLPRDLRPDIYS